MGVIYLRVEYEGPEDAGLYVGYRLAAQLREDDDVEAVTWTVEPPPDPHPMALEPLGPLPSRTWPG
jgi:hypothetical protein